MNKHTDQAEIECSNRVLLAECDLYEIRIRESVKQVPPRPPAVAGQDILAANAALVAHVAQLKTLAGTPASATTQKPEASAEPKTITEKILAAKGVKDVSELRAYRDPLD
jgi:hypothetical protein